MKTDTYSDARQRLASLLDRAGREGQVQIRRQDGSTLVLQPVVTTRSPLDVPSVRRTLRRGKLADLIRAERDGAGTRIVKGLANKRLQPTKPQPQTRVRPKTKR